MNDMINKLRLQLEKHNNVLFYKQDLYKYFKNRDKNIKAVYILTPKKGKNAIENILKAIDKNTTTKNMTISNLIEQIQIKSENKKLHIYIDSFEQLSKRELFYYQELESSKNIQLIANFNEDKEFINEDFLNKFVILNNKNFQENRSQSINITFTILLLFSVLIFILFIRLQLSVLNYLINALWFTLLMYRSFYYIIH